MTGGRPLSASLRSQEHSFQTRGSDDWAARERPSTSPAGPVWEHDVRRSGASLSQSRPWTSSVASVRSVMSSGGADWSDWPRDGVIGPLTPMEPINHRTDWRANAMVSKVRKSCTEYKGAKREDNLQAFQGLWSSMSFRRPRGVDVIHAAAVAARKPRPQPARGFTERGGPGPAAARRTPYDIAKECPFLQKLEDQLQGFVQMLVEEDGLSFLSEVAGQVLYREKDMLFNAYILLAGSVQQFSNDYDFLNSVGWRGHAEQTDKAEEERPERPKRLHRQPTMRSTQRTAEQHLSMPTLTEHVRQVGRREEDQEMRFRTVEGQSDFTQDSILGDLFDTAVTPGALVGEPALLGEQVWRHTAMCLKDCELLAIKAQVFSKVLQTMKDNQRFFERFLPGLPQKVLKPHPNDYWTREFLPEGAKLLEEGMELLEPAVWMVQQGRVELRRFRRSGANPAYVFATRPLAGKPTKMTTKDVPSVLPEYGRSFEPDVDEQGLPCIGLPPALKGSMRQKMEAEYLKDPKNFIPHFKGLSEEEAKVRHHKVLLKARLDTTLERKRERDQQREEEAAEWKPRQAEDVDTRSPEQIEKIKELLEHVQRLQAARPGSPEYVGHDTWSDRERPWLSRDLATGSVTRPMSAKIILDPLVRSELPESQDTIATLKMGDLFCSLNFFPICGAPEPFTAIAASPDCCVVSVKGVQQSKNLPKVVLKEIRSDLLKALQNRLNELIRAETASKDSGVSRMTANDALKLNSFHMEEEEAEPEASPEIPQVSEIKSESTHCSEPVSPPARTERRRSSQSFAPDVSFSPAPPWVEPPEPPARPRKRHHRPSMLRWLFFGKGTKERRSWWFW